jgi:hypothetical protein
LYDSSATLPGVGLCTVWSASIALLNAAESVVIGCRTSYSPPGLPGSRKETIASLAFVSSPRSPATSFAALDFAFWIETSMLPVVSTATSTSIGGETVPARTAVEAGDATSRAVASATTIDFMMLPPEV